MNCTDITNFSDADLDALLTAATGKRPSLRGGFFVALLRSQAPLHVAPLSRCQPIEPRPPRTRQHGP